MAYRFNPKTGMIECDTAEEALALTRVNNGRGGGNKSNSSGNTVTAAAVPSTPVMNSNGIESAGGPPNDVALLKALYEAGARGVLTGLISGMIHAERKGIPGALDGWAQRMKLIGADGGRAVVRVRIGQRRGWALTPGAQLTAKEILAILN